MSDKGFNITNDGYFEFKKDITKTVNSLLKNRRDIMRKYEAQLFDEWLCNCLEKMYEHGKAEAEAEHQAAIAQAKVEVLDEIYIFADCSMTNHIDMNRIFEKINTLKSEITSGGAS